jgi:hypothetical protein
VYWRATLNEPGIRTILEQEYRRFSAAEYTRRRQHRHARTPHGFARLQS